MSKLIRLMRSGIIFLVVILCFVRKSDTFEVSPTHRTSEVLAGKEIWRLTTNEEESTSDKTQTDGKYAAERDSSLFKNYVEKETKRNSDQETLTSDEIFNPFMDLPFFPFHMQSLKKNTSYANSSKRGIRLQEDERGAGIRSPRKPKPFLFIDFAFHIEEIPIKNGTRERQSSVKDSFHTKKPKISYDENESRTMRVRKRNEDMPFDLLEDEWPFFDDIPFLSLDTNEFLPKSKLQLFDSPFRAMQTAKQSRSNGDKFLVPPKSDTNIFQGIFDQAMSSMKREMERASPLWNLFVGSRKVMHSREHEGSLSSVVNDILPLQHPENKMNDSFLINVMTPVQNELSFRQNPVVAGHVEKIEEIHIGDGRSRIKKKRRNSRGLTKIEKQALRENSIKPRHLDEGIKTKFPNLGYLPARLNDMFHRIREVPLEDKKESEKTTLGIQNVKILDIMSQRSLREMEDQAKGKTTKSETFETDGRKEVGTENGSEGSRSSTLENKRFKYTGEIHGINENSRNGGGFEILRPQQSSSWRTRQESDRGGIWENVTASKDEFTKNITHVLGKFFSMIKNLRESKDNEDKNSQEIDDINWPEIGQIRASPSYAHADEKGMREGRQAAVEDESPPAPVADLTFLLLTVTLPTTLAFTILLVICIVNLRAKSWLCKKVFQPRNLYLVEEDVEKSERLEIKPMVSGDAQHGRELKKTERVKETRDKRRQ